MSDANFQIKIGVETQLAQLKAMEAQFERQIVQLRTLGTGGADALKKVETNLSMVRAELVKTASTSGAMGSTAGFAFKNVGQAVGQAGYQMQDFAVQVAGGQSALTAFAQQGSQLLGIFGPTGIIAGAVLAVGVLAIKMLNLGDATKSAAEYAKDADTSWAKYAETIKKIRTENATPGQKIETTTTRVDAIKKEQAQLNKIEEVNDKRINERDLGVFRKYALSAEQYVFPTLEKQIAYQDAINAARAKGESAPSALDDKFGGGAISSAFSDSGQDAAVAQKEQISARRAELAQELATLTNDKNKEIKILRDATDANADLMRSDTERLDNLKAKQAEAMAQGKQGSVEYITRQGQIITLEKTLSDEQIKNVGKLAREQINLQINVEDSQRKQIQNSEKLAKAEAQKLATMTADQELSDAIAASKLAIAQIEANRLLDDVEKNAKIIPLLEAQNVAIQKRIDLLKTENGVDSNPVSVELRKTKVEKLTEQQGGNAVTIGKATPLGIGGSLAAASTSYMSQVGTVADQVGRAWSNVGQGMSSSLGTAFSDMILKAESFKDAMASFGNAVLQSVVQAMANMVADWIVSHTVMAAVRSIFHTEGTIEQGVHTGAQVAIHTGGEVAKTAATAGGTAARTGISLWETITHGLHVAWRTITHVAGEAAKTGATIIGSGIRIGTVISESIANVWNAGIGALSAMASIPYVGPILAVAAMGAILGVGFAAASNIGKFAEGGPVNGKGSGTSDSIPAWLSNGEYVMPAAETAKYRPLLDSMRNGTLNPGQLTPVKGEYYDAPSGPGGSVVNLAFFDSRPSAEQWAKSSDGEAHFVDVAQRNSHRISGNG
jgi:hypothetical protein